MELRRTETGFALYKEKDVIGHCTLHPAAQGATAEKWSMTIPRSNAASKLSV